MPGTPGSDVFLTPSALKSLKAKPEIVPVSPAAYTKGWMPPPTFKPVIERQHAIIVATEMHVAFLLFVVSQLQTYPDFPGRYVIHSSVIQDLAVAIQIMLQALSHAAFLLPV